MSALRPGLLDGLAVTLDGPADDAALAGQLERLGARLAGPDSGALVFDAAPAFGQGGDEGLMAMLEAAWNAMLRLAPALIESQRPGKFILLTPSPHAGPLAAAAADALENLARTLSVEWARFGITTCAVAPGAGTTPDAVAELVAYLLSGAGDYLTGCRLDLDAVNQSPRPGSSAQGTITASS